MLYQNSSKGKEESVLLRHGLSRAYHMMFYHIYDVHLLHCAYTIAIYSVFNIMLPFLYFIKNRMYEHLKSF